MPPLSGIPRAPDGWETSSVLLFKKGNVAVADSFRRIGLSPIFSKMFNYFHARDIASYAVSNNFIDTTFQKAFIRGVEGWLEHTTVLAELVKDTRSRARTLHFTSLDLKDAFGSLSQDLIKCVLKRVHIPQPFISYISNLYNRLSTTVRTKRGATDTTPIRVGTSVNVAGAGGA